MPTRTYYLPKAIIPWDSLRLPSGQVLNHGVSCGVLPVYESRAACVTDHPGCEVLVLTAEVDAAPVPPPVTHAVDVAPAALLADTAHPPTDWEGVPRATVPPDDDPPEPEDTLLAAECRKLDELCAGRPEAREYLALESQLPPEADVRTHLEEVYRRRGPADGTAFVADLLQSFEH